MLPVKFQVNWPFSSEEKGKNRFSTWPPSWISDWNNFSYFKLFVFVVALSQLICDLSNGLFFFLFLSFEEEYMGLTVNGA